jgi:hypothetical protein
MEWGICEETQGVWMCLYVCAVCLHDSCKCGVNSKYGGWKSSHKIPSSSWILIHFAFLYVLNSHHEMFSKFVLLSVTVSLFWNAKYSFLWDLSLLPAIYLHVYPVIFCWIFFCSSFLYSKWIFLLFFRYNGVYYDCLIGFLNW